MSPDAVNGLFEAFGAILSLMNVRQLCYDRRIEGVHWLPVLFFTGWGVWNCWYYPYLEQSISFIGGVCLVAVNSTWLVLLFLFTYLEERTCLQE